MKKLIIIGLLMTCSSSVYADTFRTSTGAQCTVDNPQNGEKYSEVTLNSTFADKDVISNSTTATGSTLTNDDGLTLGLRMGIRKPLGKPVPSLSCEDLLELEEERMALTLKREALEIQLLEQQIKMQEEQLKNPQSNNSSTTNQAAPIPPVSEDNPEDLF